MNAGLFMHMSQNGLCKDGTMRGTSVRLEEPAALSMAIVKEAALMVRLRQQSQGKPNPCTQDNQSLPRRSVTDGIPA